MKSNRSHSFKPFGQIFTALVVSLFFQAAHAGGVIEFNYGGGLFSSGPATKRDNNVYLIRTGIYLSPFIDGSFYIGGGANYVSQSVKTDDLESYTAVDYIFGFKWSLAKKNWLWLSAYVAPNSSAEFKSTGEETQTWTGMSGVGSLSIYYPTTRGLLLGFSLDYYQAQYTKKTTPTSSESSTQTVTGTYPSISIGYNW